MKPDPLWAKSWKSDSDPPPPNVFLPMHLQDVYAAGVQVLDCTADYQLRAVGLAPDEWRDRFRRIVLLGAAVHDIGKANDHFVGMITGERRDVPQGLRHEWVTLLMMEHSPLRSWLLPVVGNSEADWLIAECAITGHHPAYNRASPPRLFVDGAGSDIKLLMGHADFRRCLEWIGQIFRLPAAPNLEMITRRLVGEGNVFAREIMPWFVRARGTWDRFSEAEKRLTAAAKGCLIGADVAGSALWERGRDAALIKAYFEAVPTREQLRKIVADRLKGNPLHPFQSAVAESSAQVTFVRAGCGSGKTLAAYQWAATQHPGRRLYFCYPTTGTATEGYRDYLFEAAEELNANLFHGRATTDLEIVLGVNARDERDDSDLIARIESLDAWSTPIVACTVDTVLGLMQNSRRGLYAWPALAGSAFVFDEIHSYDDKLFGALLRFLQTLPGVPVLLMTASLPQARFRALQVVMAKRGQEFPVLPTAPLESEFWKRYHLQGSVDDRDPCGEVEEELKRGGKVLWVCNTVDRAIAAANRLAKFQPRIYHSRFRYEDRVARHKEVVAAFTAEVPGPVVACCTQVAEMSLDLKGVTLLVTELAPVPALIQRLGRLNRQATASTLTRPFIVLEPESPLPYESPVLDAARDWLMKLGAGPLSQDDLAKAWHEIDDERRPAFVSSAWLDGGPCTQVLELREASPGITVVLQRDADAVKLKRISPIRVAIPMPPPRGKWRDQWRRWPVVKGLPVAPQDAIRYDALRGAQWEGK